MAVYAIIGGRNAELLGPVVERLYPKDCYFLPPGCWFIYAAATTKEVSRALQIPNGENGATAVVVPVNNYSGWAPSSLWEWLRSREVGASDG